MFYRDKTLFAQHFDLSKLELTGEALPILTDIQYQPRIGRAVFSVFNDRVLLAQNGTGVSPSQLEWFDRSGKEVGAAGKPDVYANVNLAPNGNLWLSIRPIREIRTLTSGSTTCTAKARSG